jgi:L-rhamnose isomerase
MIMKKYFLVLFGEFKSEEFCKDVALTITPMVDSPQLKFQHSNGALLFHFASEVDQAEMYDFFSVSFFGLVSSFILTENTDNLSLYMPEDAKVHLLDLENASGDVSMNIDLSDPNLFEDEFDEEDEDDFMALVLNKVKDKIKRPSLDQLLEKVGNKGVESLTPFEKDTLDAYSKN